MKKVLITFGDSKYQGALGRLKTSAQTIGRVDEVIIYGPDDYSKKYAWRNSYILNQPRGSGYWMWKPYIILETFKNLNDGDIVLYSDAGLTVIDDLSPLFEAARKSSGQKVIFKIPAHGVKAVLANTWTKRDCFVLMDCDEPKYWTADLTNGAVSLWVKTDKNIEFLKEWSRYMKDPRIVTDEPNIMGKPNRPEFKDHRHDQSVLSLLAIKYEFEMFRDPTQFGKMDLDKYDNSPYGVLFDHHRQQN